MRTVTSDFITVDPTDSLRGMLDQFAAIHNYASATPPIGGYRVLTPRRGYLPKRRTKVATASALAALAQARMHMTGVLSVLFIGGMGLAIFAGPATCTQCNGSFHMAEHASMESATSGENSSDEDRVAASTHRHADRAADLPTVTARTEPEANTPSASPITTAGLEPIRDILSNRIDRAERAGRLPSRIEPLTDTGPTVRLAAMDTRSLALEVLPAIEVSTPRTTTAAIEQSPAKAESDDRSRAQRKRIVRAYRTPIAKRAKPLPHSSTEFVQRAPRWSQQMYVGSWQSQAFSYTR